MATKKRTSKAKSSSVQQPSERQAERIERLTALFRQHAAQFEADDRSQEVLLSATGYWTGWPGFLSVMRVNEMALDVGEQTLSRHQLRQTHLAATCYLMREAKRRGIDPSPLWEESRYCCELMLKDHIGFGVWPDVLGEHRYGLPSALQQAITDGEACFAHLMTQLDIDSTTAKAQMAEATEILLETGAKHSDDFHSVMWFGTEYTFTGPQAVCVKLLYEHWERGTPEVSGNHLVETAECGRITDLFRNHSAWNTMIVSGRTKGNYRLQEPEE